MPNPVPPKYNSSASGIEGNCGIFLIAGRLKVFEQYAMSNRSEKSSISFTVSPRVLWYADNFIKGSDGKFTASHHNPILFIFSSPPVLAQAVVKSA
jgi:hypothetical protein